MQYSICGSIQEYVWLGGGLMRADDYRPLKHAWERLWKALDSVDVEQQMVAEWDQWNDRSPKVTVISWVMPTS